MRQLTDEPYSTLVVEERNYTIMLLVDQCDKSQKAIAEEFGIAISRIQQIYNRIKMRQVQLYAQHLAVVHGHEDTSAFDFMGLCDFYGNAKYVSAYWEKEYTEILAEYRSGEPGYSAKFLAALPLPTFEVTDDMVQRVVTMRDKKMKSYILIGKEMGMTKEKAKAIHEHFYHEKFMAVCDKVSKSNYYEGITVGDLMDDYYNYKSARKRLEAVMQDYPHVSVYTSVQTVQN